MSLFNENQHPDATASILGMVKPEGRIVAGK